MDKFLADTNIIQGTPLSWRNLPTPLYFSAIVFSELMTASNDAKELKNYQKAWKDAVNENLLVVPSPEDWLKASRIQFFLAQERKKNAGGKSPKRSARIKQELALDCLIAVGCARQNITVVTNDGDFFSIRRYLKGLKLLRV